jgi:hypothetical protein
MPARQHHRRKALATGLADCAALVGARSSDTNRDSRQTMRRLGRFTSLVPRQAPHARFAPRRVTSIAVALVAVSLLAVPSISFGRDTVVARYIMTTTSTETGLTDDCLPGLTGTLVGTGVVRYRSVETAEGFHITGTETGTGRIDWSDGTYSTIESVDHFSFNAGAGVEVNTDAHVDSGSLYTAEGVFLSRYTFHLVHHFTVTEGVVRVDFVKTRLNLFGAAC